MAGTVCLTLTFEDQVPKKDLEGVLHWLYCAAMPRCAYSTFRQARAVVSDGTYGKIVAVWGYGDG